MRAGSEQRRARLAAALRENLKRRKAGKRTAKAPPESPAPTSPESRPGGAQKPA